MEFNVETVHLAPLRWFMAESFRGFPAIDEAASKSKPTTATSTAASTASARDEL